jgi:ATP-dependent exoDNAse (exonuclease V) beta subunit
MENLKHCIQQEQRLTEEYRAAIDLPELTAFFLTATAYRMWKAQIAGKLFREQPFVYGIPASRLPEQINQQKTTDKWTNSSGTGSLPEQIQQQNTTGKDVNSSITSQMPVHEQHQSTRHMTDTLDSTPIESSLLSHETVLIQGIIDAFLIEDNQIMLIDYKTDQVRTPSQLWNRYALQMQYYEEALTKLMNLPVTHKVIYSFHLTQEIALPKLQSSKETI